MNTIEISTEICVYVNIYRLVKDSVDKVFEKISISPYSSLCMIQPEDGIIWVHFGVLSEILQVLGLNPENYDLDEIHRRIKSMSTEKIEGDLFTLRHRLNTLINAKVEPFLTKVLDLEIEILNLKIAKLSQRIEDSIRISQIQQISSR